MHCQRGCSSESPFRVLEQRNDVALVFIIVSQLLMSLHDAGQKPKIVPATNTRPPSTLTSNLSHLEMLNTNSDDSMCASVFDRCQLLHVKSDTRLGFLASHHACTRVAKSEHEKEGSKRQPAAQP